MKGKKGGNRLWDATFATATVHGLSFSFFSCAAAVTTVPVETATAVVAAVTHQAAAVAAKL